MLRNLGQVVECGAAHGAEANHGVLEDTDSGSSSTTIVGVALCLATLPVRVAQCIRLAWRTLIWLRLRGMSRHDDPGLR